MLRIKEAKKTFFVSKEHYLDFLRAWKKAATQDDESLRPTPPHYIIFALLREKPENHGFTPVTSPKKLKGGREPHDAEYSARNYIIYNCKPVKMGVSPGNRLDWLLKPFGGYITPGQLVLIGDLLHSTEGAAKPLIEDKYVPGFEPGAVYE